MNKLIKTVPLRPLFALSAAFLFAACPVGTKLGELTEGDQSSDPSASDPSASEPSTSDPSTSGPSASEPSTSDTLPPPTIPSMPSAPYELDTDPDPSASAGSDETGLDPSGGECTPVTAMRAALSPNVVLVLDKSGSMVSSIGGMWDHDADSSTPPVTRWSSLHEVVDAVVTEFDDTINFGAHLFPNTTATADYSAQACTVNENIDIAVASMNKDAILTGIPAAEDTSLRGGTPMSAGVTVALEHLKTLDPEVPRALLLVTDGAANCLDDADPQVIFEQYDASIHQIIGDAYALDGIPTYVVGVGIQDIVTPLVKDGNPDNVNTFTRLNELAAEGGKPKDDPNEKFFNTQNQIELAAALDTVAVDALTCIIPLDKPLAAPDEITVEVGGLQIPHVSDCGDTSGWVFANPGGPFNSIRVCGDACGGLKVAGQAAITVCQ